MDCGTKCPRGKAPSLGGRIIKVTATRPSFFNNPQYHGHMAPTFGRKYLTCFYCNKKSGIRYDGLITQWECAKCDSMNFLDEDGDITDPPVATDRQPPSDLKYSLARPESPVSKTSHQGSDSIAFCTTCIKNQHLYTSSLAQYHVETDPSHPEYKESERRYFQYRKNLERRYPQVCEDCEPKVLERMREAGKTAKTDYLRRLMDKSRARRFASRRNNITLGGILDFMGRLFWHIGLVGQLLWHLTTLTVTTRQHYEAIPNSSLSVFITAPLTAVFELSATIPAENSMGRWGLICSTASLWWNPKFKHLNKGFVNHIKGFGDWYKHQFILLVVRSLFYFIMRKEDFGASVPQVTVAAHGFLAFFVTFLAFRAHRSLKVDMTTLWASTPEKLPHVGPRCSPDRTSNSMEDVLNAISASPARRNKPTTSLSSSSPSSYDRYQSQTYQAGSIRIGHDRTAPIQPLKALNISVNRGRTSPTLFKNTYHPTSGSQSPLDEHYGGLTLGDMDWSPSQPTSQHRAFIENLPVDKDAEFFGRAPVKKNTKLFSQSPLVPQPSTFWYKVPAAPITPAHQLRNPPNQPRMRVSSEEVKENFFNNIAQRKSSTQDPLETQPSTNHGSQREGIDFAQQKFFAPPILSEEHNALVDAMSGWSLADPDSPLKKVENSRFRHFGQGVALLFGLIFWNQALNNPSEHTTNITLAVMFGCLCIGGRNILDNTIYIIEDTQNIVMHSLATCFGGLECAAAGYGILEILGGRGDCGNCSSLGTILVGGMMVHEIWLSLFR